MGTYCCKCDEKTHSYITPKTCECCCAYCLACWRYLFFETMRFKEDRTNTYYTRRGDSDSDACDSNACDSNACDYDKVESRIFIGTSIATPKCPRCNVDYEESAIHDDN